MKVACFVNPLVQARGPCFNFGWVETLANLLQPLRRDARCECMLIAGGWFKDWASQNQKGALLTGLRTVWIDELALYRRLRALGELPTALDQTAYQADDAEHPALRVIAEAMARDVNGFEPDIIIGFAGQANYLARLWPSALRLHIERGHFGRDPYPFSMYFDHVGTHARSAVARVGGLKLAYPLTSDGRALVSAFRSQMAAAFDSLDPFRSQSLRKRFDRLCLLPLQVSNEFSFDGLVNYRTQFEYLYDVLAAAPKDVAVIVTEHPERRSRSETIRLLREHRHASQDVSEYRLSRRIPAVPVAVATPGAASRRRLERSRRALVTRRCCSAVCSALRPPRNCRMSRMRQRTRIFLPGSGIASQPMSTPTTSWPGCWSVTWCRRRCSPTAAGSTTICSVGSMRRAGKRPDRCVRADGGRRSPHGGLDRQDPPPLTMGSPSRRG